MSKNIFIGDLEELTDYAVCLWLEVCTAALREKAYCAVALSGGTTPKPFYEKLASETDASLWQTTHIFQVDERFVPPDHRDSNFRLIRETLTSLVPIPEHNLHPVPITGTPEDSARAYDHELQTFFKPSRGSIPSFDLMVLGIGIDGHTASLFPGDRAVNETTRLATSVIVSDDRHHRITFTLPVIKNAACRVFMATGREKSAILKRVLEGAKTRLPAYLAGIGKGTVFYLIDPDAAKELSKKTVSRYGLVHEKGGSGSSETCR